MTAYIPANPVVDLTASRDHRKLIVPRPGVFSVARHALLAYLRYAAKVRGRPVRTVLIPDYMCHEVDAALLRAGYALRRYALDEDLRVSLPGLDEALAAGPAEAAILTHFYGRLDPNASRVAERCRRAGVDLIEDCVHLPFPFYGEYPSAPPEALSDARLFTFRKVYPVPLGAAIVLRTGQEAFARFVDDEIGRRYPDDRWETWRWLGKQLVKKSLIAAGLRYPQTYRDLSQDPLKPYNFMPPAFERMLSVAHLERAVARRRENGRLYRELAPAIAERWGRCIDYAPTDVPYMFVVFLRAGLDPLAVVKGFMARGIPAALGLALDPEFLATLPADHRYRRVLALPVHQDVRPRDIAFIGEALKAGPAA